MKKKYLVLSLILSLGLLVSPLYQAEELTVRTSPTDSQASHTTVEGPSSSTEATETTVQEEPTVEEERAGNPVRSIGEGIIGEDGQFRVQNTTADPYRKIVRLYMSFGNSSYVGTGTMIGPDTVLTAAHNIYDPETKKWADEVVAYPAMSGAERPYGSYISRHYYMLRNYSIKDGDTVHQYDTAVLKLSSPVSAEIGSLSVSTEFSDGQRIQVAGYPSVTNEKRGYMYTMFDRIDQSDDDYLYYTIDTEGGQSGGPVLNERNEIIGVHILGAIEGDAYVVNLARRINADTLELIDIAQNGKSLTPTVTSNQEPESTIIYRLYEPTQKYYFYTRSLTEAQILTERGWRFEGGAFKTQQSGQAVYRLYNAERKAYLYTMNQAERESIIQRGWADEGVAWYSAGEQKIYRLFSPTTKTHMYTRSQKEVKILQNMGWKYEGVAFYTVQ